MKKYLVSFLLLLSLSLSAQTAKYQMRAVWVASVTNVDWPSAPNLSVEEQQKEMTTMLDRFKELNINTVVFQIRPASDAFYVSAYEPWSVWLDGSGVAPTPFYDPLEFVIREAHERCIEVHVWFNPYRVSMEDTTRLCKEHPLFRFPDLIKKYGTRYYFDPGRDETRAYLNKIVADVVMRYDVDAVHFDDYFYPYRVQGQDFPDEDTFQSNPRGYKPDQRDDWRRNNVNLIISELHNTIKSIKPWVDFGISPFGVWRNARTDVRGSRTTAGTTNYDDLYADVYSWLENGTIDYVVPQLYWEIGKPVADYRVLLDWWCNNSFGRNLYIGLFASGLKNQKSLAWNRGNEIVRQMELNKKYPQQEGVFLYSARPLLKNPIGICDSLKNNYFRYPSLVPRHHGDTTVNVNAPQNVRILKNEQESRLVWNENQLSGGEQTSYYVVYAFKKGENKDYNSSQNIIGKTVVAYFEIPNLYANGEYEFAVSSVNRYRTESAPTEMH